MSTQLLTPEQAQIKAVTDVFATYYACVASVAIWDWLSCLPDEYKLIWKSRWSGIKFLYILIRYWGLLTICAVMPSLYAQWTKEFCLGYVYVGAIMWCVTSMAGAVVLLLRCYSVWNFDKRILALLSILLINQATWQLFNTFHTFEPLPIVGETGPCFPTPKPEDGKLVLGYGTSAFVFDLTATALATYKSVQLRKRGVNQALITVILRDGILYYVAATVLYALKEAFELQTANPLIQTINAGCTLTLIPVLICRLILSLRRQGQLMTMDHPSTFSQSGVSHHKSGISHGATSGFRGNISHAAPMDIGKSSKHVVDGEDSLAMDILRDEESGKGGYGFHSSSDNSHPYAYPDDGRMRVHVVQTTVRS